MLAAAKPQDLRRQNFSRFPCLPGTLALPLQTAAPRGPGPLLYLLVEGVHKPLIPHEIAGHVHISVVEQDPVFLEQDRGKGGDLEQAQVPALTGPSPTPQGFKEPS